MSDDYEKFCLKCSWLDSDYGCTSPTNEEVYQCPMYMYYHPEEVKQFEEDMKKWCEETRRKGE